MNIEKDKLRQVMAKVVHIDDEAWHVAEPMFKLKVLRKREYFQRQGEVCRHIGFIHSGYMRLFYNLDGLEVTKDFNTEYSFCGSYASFISGKPAHFNVITMEAVQLQTIDLNSLTQLTDKYMAWQKFLRIAMKRMFISKENREALFLTSMPEERYAALVCEKPEWVNRIPLKYLASYLGIAPETLSRIRGRKTLIS